MDSRRIGALGDLVSKRTGESSVYWNRAELAFYKVKSMTAKMPIKRTSPSDWLYEHVVHNILFPESAYEFVGVCEECGEAKFVFRQDAVRTERFADEERIEAELAARGLEPEGRLFFGDGVVSVTDVGAHGDNVLLDDNDKVRFIDPLIRLNKPANEVIEWLTGYDPKRDGGPKGFTLIELLVVIGIMGLMVTVGIVSVGRGKGAVRVKGATRDIYAAIRHARSTALVTGQPAIITYSTVEEDGEPMAKIEIHSAKLFDSSFDRSKIQTLSGEPLEGEGFELVHIEESKAEAVNKKAKGAKGAESEDAEGDESEKGGDSIEDVLFAPMDTEIVKGMRIKAVKGDEELQEANGGRRTKISVFSNVDYLIGKFKDAKAEAKKKEAEKNGTADADKDDAKAKVDEQDEPVSVVWETNGRVDPHRVWVYADGQKPEDGLQIKIDRFGAAKVIAGDGRDEDD